MIKYRKLTDLTDAEVEFIMKDIFDTDTVTEIVRFERNNCIECDIHIMDNDDETPFYDRMTLEETELYTDSFEVTSDEQNKYLKYLLAKGIDWRFENNPYLTE